MYRGKKGLDFKMKKYNCVNCKQVIVFESNGKFQEYEPHFETGFKYCWNCAIKECKIDIEWAKHLGLGRK